MMLPRKIFALCAPVVLLLAACDSPSDPGAGESRFLEIYDTAQISVKHPLGTPVDTLRQGRSYRVEVVPSGSGLTYRWGFRGVWTPPDTSPRFAFPALRKSDSGTTVSCIVSSASIHDTLVSKVRVMMASWQEMFIGAGAQGSGSYGPFLNFDTASDPHIDQRRDSALGTQEAMDLVTAFIATGTGPDPSGVYKLLSPRLALRMGISATAGMDSTRLTATKMVLVPRSSLDQASQERAQVLYDEGVKRDSLVFADSGSFGGSTSNVVLVKTSTGRLIQLTGISFNGGAGAEATYNIDGKRGSIRD